MHPGNSTWRAAGCHGLPQGLSSAELAVVLSLDLLSFPATQLKILELLAPSELKLSCALARVDGDIPPPGINPRVLWGVDSGPLTLMFLTPEVLVPRVS